MATITIGNVSMISDGDYIDASSHNKNHYVYVPIDNITYVSLKDNNAVTPTNDHINWQILCKGIGVTTDNNYTNADKTKLDGIATSATNTASSSTNGNIKINNVDTVVYTHPTDDGNLHVPATSTINNGKVLKAGSTAGSLSWGTLTDSDIGAKTGIWTPTIYGSTTVGTPTYTSQSGTYYKIGSLVYLYFSIAISAKGGIAGNICFGGLPFALSGRGFLDISSYVGLTTPSSSIPTGLMTGNLVALYCKLNTFINPCTDSMISDTFALYGATAIYTTA